MRRTAIVAVLVLTLGIAASAALADSEHFNSKSTFGTLSADGKSLRVDFKVSGLGTATPKVFVFVTGSAQCVNNGDHHPKADNKSGFTVGNTFDVVNGTSSGFLVATSGAHCGTGQTLEFLDVAIHEADSDAALTDSSQIDASLSLGNFP